MQSILTALLVVLIVALASGIILALSSHFFRVEIDEKEAEVRANLPGANCGACGYAGCDDYAKAVASGEAKPNLCIPGGADCAESISEIMGVESEKPEDLVAFVKCDGRFSVANDKAHYEGIKTCAAASNVYGGPKSCVYGCVGCGDCARICPVNAICINEGIACVDPRICVGCSLCAKTCPKGIIAMLPPNAKAVVMCSSHDKGAEARKKCGNACIACRKCEKTCPHGAIEVKDNLAQIDYNKCTGCLECVKVCPTGCIKEIDISVNGEL